MTDKNKAFFAYVSFDLTVAQAGCTPVIAKTKEEATELLTRAHVNDKIANFKIHQVMDINELEQKEAERIKLMTGLYDTPDTPETPEKLN